MLLQIHPLSLVVLNNNKEYIIDPFTLLAAFAPLAVDLGKSLIAKFVAPEQFKPATIEQYTQIKQIRSRYVQGFKRGRRI